MNKEEKEYLECEDCLTLDETVSEDHCPYAEELYDDLVIVNLCPDCFSQRAMDVQL